MIITYSEPKDDLGRSGKGLITSLGLKTNVRSNKYKKARYAITNVSMKYLSNIIKDIEKLSYKGYVRKRPKHEPTDSYFYLKTQSSKCRMIDNALNLQINPVRTEITGTQKIPVLHICSTDERESK